MRSDGVFVQVQPESEVDLLGYPGVPTKNSIHDSFSTLGTVPDEEISKHRE